MATPRGWYDVGDGYAGMWDGERWTGERISHEQLAALSRPPAPPPPSAPPTPSHLHARSAPARGLPWWAWIILIVVFLLVGLPLLGAFAEGFSTGLNGR